jgi:hypothetical protein
MSKTATKIEQIDVEDLIPYARNARTHSEQQVTQIAASIRMAECWQRRSWGWTECPAFVSRT